MQLHTLSYIWSCMERVYDFLSYEVLHWMFDISTNRALQSAVQRFFFRACRSSATRSYSRITILAKIQHENHVPHICKLHHFRAFFLAPASAFAAAPRFGVCSACSADAMGFGLSFGEALGFALLRGTVAFEEPPLGITVLPAAMKCIKELSFPVWGEKKEE